MKITNSETIKSSEQELIDAITGDLDWGSIEEVIRQRHKLNIQDDVAYRDGDIIVHDSQVAYRLDFEVKMNLSVIFDRNGNFLSLKTNEATDETPPPSSDAQDEGPASGDEQELASATDDPPSGSEETDFVKLTSELVDMSDETTGEAPPGDAVDEYQAPAPEADAQQGVHLVQAPQEKRATMASRIADMISEINEGPSGSDNTD